MAAAACVCAGPSDRLMILSGRTGRDQPSDLRAFFEPQGPRPEFRLFAAKVKVQRIRDRRSRQQVSVSGRVAVCPVLTGRNALNITRSGQAILAPLLLKYLARRTDWNCEFLCFCNCIMTLTEPIPHRIILDHFRQIRLTATDNCPTQTIPKNALDRTAEP